MATMVSKAVLWGCRPIPENIMGIPPGAKVRFRVRNNDCIRCFIKDGNSVKHYILMANTMAGPWWLEPQGENWKDEQPLRPRTPQYEDHVRLCSAL